MGRKRKRSIPCALCSKPVHGPADGVGFKVGNKKFAACKQCAPAVRDTASSVGKALRRVIEGRYPKFGVALQMAEAALRAPEDS